MTPDAAARLDVPRGNVIDGDPRSRGEAKVSEPAHPRLTYRPALDGLRAIAVGLVVVSHLQVPFTAWGGWAGVTLFFVLSGFLITSLLVSELDGSGRIDLVAFYARRARRLLPALALVMLASAYLLVVTGKAGELAGDLLPVALYVSNFARVGGAQLAYLPQAWSLSIEEQFYLLWPAILILAPRRWWLAILLGGIAFSAAWRVIVAGQADLHFGTFSRGDAILYGCVLALLAIRWPSWSWLAGAAILAWVVPHPAGTPMDGLVPLATVWGSVLVVAAAPAWLGWRPLVEVGKRSYGIYLWHWIPIELGLPGPAVVIFALSAAWISYRYVERPIRAWRPTFRRRAALASLGS